MIAELFPTRTRFLRFPGLFLAGLLAVASGCDEDTTALIEEINAAREGCTEEMLRASDEVCVQMFEKYSTMGEEAIETYVGGMTALDQALERRGGVMFDTVGIGRAISDRYLNEPAGDATAASAFDTVFEPSFQRYGADRSETGFSRDVRQSAHTARPQMIVAPARLGVNLPFHRGIRRLRKIVSARPVIAFLPPGGGRSSLRRNGFAVHGSTGMG